MCTCNGAVSHPTLARWPASLCGSFPGRPLHTRLPEGPELTVEPAPAGPPRSPSLWASPGSPTQPLGTHPPPQSLADNQMAPGRQMGSSSSRTGLGQMTGMLHGQLQQPDSYSMLSTLHAPSGGGLLKEQRASTGGGPLWYSTQSHLPGISVAGRAVRWQQTLSVPPPLSAPVCTWAGLLGSTHLGTPLRAITCIVPVPALKLLDEQCGDAV